jgi:hypothetical protein
LKNVKVKGKEGQGEGEEEKEQEKQQKKLVLRWWGEVLRPRPAQQL